MNTNKLLYWGEGLFIEPQHFQFLSQLSHDVHFDILGKMFQHTNGFINYEINLPMVQKGILALDSFELFLNNTNIIYPINTKLITRNLKKEDFATTEKIKYYLGIKKKDNQGSDIHIEHSKNLSKLNTRYAHLVNENEKLISLYENNDDVIVPNIYYVVSIFSEYELNSLIEYDYIPFCEIGFKEDTFSLLDSYIPPILNINSNEVFLDILNDLNITLLNSIQLCSNNKFNTNNIVIMSNLNATYVTLADALKNSFCHPNFIYQEVHKLLAKIIVFSNTYDFNFVLKNNDLQYDHFNLNIAFETQIDILKLLLKEIITVKKIVPKDFRFQFDKNDNNYALENIDEKYFQNTYDFYLEIFSENLNDTKAKIDLLKISDIEHLAIVVVSAVTDIHFGLAESEDLLFSHNPQLAFYIKLNTNEESWERVKASKSIGIFSDEIDITKINLIISGH